MRLYYAYFVLALGGVAASLTAPPDSWWTTAIAVLEGVGAGAARVNALKNGQVDASAK